MEEIEFIKMHGLGNDFVVIDARARAVALRYAEEASAAPKVVAKGVGGTADNIVALARDAGVPVREYADLVAMLGACELGDEIPVELYSAVAEVLVHLYELNDRLRSSEDSSG